MEQVPREQPPTPPRTVQVEKAQCSGFSPAHLLEKECLQKWFV